MFLTLDLIAFPAAPDSAFIVLAVNFVYRRDSFSLSGSRRQQEDMRRYFCPKCIFSASSIFLQSATFKFFFNQVNIFHQGRVTSLNKVPYHKNTNPSFKNTKNIVPIDKLN